jgi:hypothetical protein
MAMLQRLALLQPYRMNINSLMLNSLCLTVNERFHAVPNKWAVGSAASARYLPAASGGEDYARGDFATPDSDDSRWELGPKSALLDRQSQLSR